MRQVGVEIIQRAIRRPAKTIANNAGLEGDVIVGKLLEREGDETVGFNAAAGRFEDMVRAGVIDPMKVRAGGGQEGRKGSGVLRSRS
jgi:chaperonin GroEL